MINEFNELDIVGTIYIRILNIYEDSSLIFIFVVETIRHAAGKISFF